MSKLGTPEFFAKIEELEAEARCLDIHGVDVDVAIALINIVRRFSAIRRELIAAIDRGETLGGKVSRTLSIIDGAINEAQQLIEESKQ